MLNDASSVHRQAWDLIPWIVNGSATEAERAIAEAHIQCCAACGEELQFQRHLRAAVATQTQPRCEPQHSWQELRARLDAEAADSSTASAPRHATRRGAPWTAWLVAAVIVQAIGLGALAFTLSARSTASPAGAEHSSLAYRTLAAPEAALPNATIRAVFAPAITLERLQHLLMNSGLRVVTGPSPAGVWSLGPLGPSSRSANQAAVRTLRADSQVRFAEVVGGEQ